MWGRWQSRRRRHSRPSIHRPGGRVFYPDRCSAQTADGEMRSHDRSSKSRDTLAQSSANLVNSEDLTLDAVVLNPCTTGPLMSWHVHTHHMLVSGKMLGKKNIYWPLGKYGIIPLCIYYNLLSRFAGLCVCVCVCVTVTKGSHMSLFAEKPCSSRIDGVAPPGVPRLE